MPAYGPLEDFMLPLAGASPAAICSGRGRSRERRPIRAGQVGPDREGVGARLTAAQVPEHNAEREDEQSEVRGTTSPESPLVLRLCAGAYRGPCRNLVL